MSKDTVFTTVNLSDSKVATIIECKAFHYFNAMEKANGDTVLFFKYLILELLRIDNKKIKLDYLNNLPYSDFSIIITSIDVMLSNSSLNLSNNLWLN